MGNADKIPPLLKKGDKIWLIAPSGRVNIEKTKKAISLIESWGLKIVPGIHLYDREGIFAGRDEDRLDDLNKALNDPEAGAVICARGGYGLSRIIDRTELSGFRSRPKWVVGYSDITVLHTYILKESGIPVIHGEMPLNYSDSNISRESLKTLREALFEGRCSYQWSPEALRQGETKSIVAGGNLSLLSNMLGMGLADYLKGKILFIEDTNEHLYRIDRMLMGLKLAGVFGNISGLVVGGMSDLIDSGIKFGRSFHELLMDLVAPYNIPVASDFPAGHINDNRALYFGREAFFRVDSLSAVLNYS